MQREELGDLMAFLVVAEERSFTRAAARFGVSQSMLSQIVRRLETRLGVKLLTRTTRSVSTTTAGEQLVGTLRPALADIDARLVALSNLREKPAGKIRISSSQHAAESLLWPAISRLVSEYPEIQVELSAHQCINIRLPGSGALYSWEFGKDGRDMHVRVDGGLVFNQITLVLQAAREGFGLACVPEDQVTGLVDSGELVRVLDDWCPPFAGYHLYYPDRRQLPPAFILLVDALRYRNSGSRPTT